MNAKVWPRLVFGALALAAIGLAGWLRLDNADRRQFHADEGVQAYQTWRLAEGDDYRYDPSEHHGPTLYFVTKWLYPALLDGDGRLNDAGIRRIPIGFGILTLVFGIFAWRRFGGLEALIWGGLAASAPLVVIYQSYFIQEGMLAAFSLFALYSVHRYMESPDWRWAAVLGFSLGAMHTTKETAVLHGLALAAVAVAMLVCQRGKRLPQAAIVWRHGLVAIGIVLVLHALFFSSFFSNPRGVVDAFATYFLYADRAQGQGHEKSFSYYVSLLLPHRREGIGWSELAFAVCVLGGWALASVRAWRGEAGERERFSFLVAAFGALLLLIYSVIPYKTPWLLLTPYLCWAYSAASFLGWLGRTMVQGSGRRRVGAAIGLFVMVLWLQAEWRHSVSMALFRYASDSRNPYLYEHTTPRYRLLVDRARSILDSEVEGGASAGVYSPDASWPLPWHLRDYARVGYWSSLEPYSPRSIDMIDTRLLGDALPSNREGDVWELYGLRPNTLISVRIAADVQPSGEPQVNP